MKTDHILQRALDFFGEMQVVKIRPIHIQEFQQFLSKIHVVKRALSNHYHQIILNRYSIS